jgi:hypothetical protein
MLSQCFSYASNHSLGIATVFKVFEVETAEVSTFWREANNKQSVILEEYLQHHFTNAILS